MARVTVEDCLAQVPNRFALAILGARRARALSEGRGRVMVESDNREGVAALREISAGQVRFKEVVADAMVDFIEEQRHQIRVTTGHDTFLEAASLRALEDEDDDGEDEDGEGPEELRSDPEGLSKQASKAAEDDDASEGEEADGEVSEEADGEVSEDAETVEADELEDAASVADGPADAGPAAT